MYVYYMCDSSLMCTLQNDEDFGPYVWIQIAMETFEPASGKYSNEVHLKRFRLQHTVAWVRVCVCEADLRIGLRTEKFTYLGSPFVGKWTSSRRDPHSGLCSKIRRIFEAIQIATRDGFGIRPRHAIVTPHRPAVTEQFRFWRSGFESAVHDEAPIPKRGIILQSYLCVHVWKEWC